MAEIIMESGKIYYVKLKYGAEVTEDLFRIASTTPISKFAAQIPADLDAGQSAREQRLWVAAYSVIPLASTTSLGYNLLSNNNIEHIVEVREIPKDELPLYIGWPHISKELATLVKETG